jgi:hypothetical protein
MSITRLSTEPATETEDLVLYTTTSALDKEKMTAIFEKGFGRAR